MNLLVKSSKGLEVKIPHQQIQYSNGLVNKGVEPPIGNLEIRTQDNGAKTLGLNIQVSPSVVSQFQAWLVSPAGDFEIWV